jgi:putative transcriptional regulator
MRKAYLTFGDAHDTIYVKLAFQMNFIGVMCLKNRLEELRKSRGIKQEALADALAVSRQTISSLESGRYNPSITLAFKIARHFGLSIEEIFIYEEE